MSLLDKINQATNSEPPCNDCEYLIYPKKNLPFCKIKDKIILPDYPPTRCEMKEG
jgi:hypothetical protein